MEPIARIEVMGKSADQVVEEVLSKLGKPSAAKAGKVRMFWAYGRKMDAGTTYLPV